MADRIERLLKVWEPRLRAAFMESFRTVRDSISIAELVKALKAGDVEAALRIVGIEPVRLRPLGAVLEQFYEAAGVDASQGVGLRIAPPFDVRAPNAEVWIRTHATDLIRQITEDQRQMVREALAPLRTGQDPLLTGETPQKLALDLVGRVSGVTGHREGGIIGLNAQQARWARNYETELGDVEAKAAPDPNALTRTLRDKRFDRTVAKAIRDGQPIPAATRQAMVAAYRNRALRYRAETIALNEASEIAHTAQVEAWDQAIARGAVEVDLVRRFWITAGDDHVRRLHREVPGMNAKGVRLHEPFQTPKGPAMQPGWRFDPGCRCRVRVRVVE
jgi:hypothetical protein